jgi:hypothetical protein
MRHLVTLQALDRRLPLMLSEPDHEQHAGESGEAKKRDSVPFALNAARKPISYPVINVRPRVDR